MRARSDFADAFMTALDSRSRVAAVEIAISARASSDGIWDVVDGVLAPAQRVAGERWEHNEWSVAQEHAATVITDLALSAVALQPDEANDDSGRVAGRVVAACPSGEWHALAVRFMVEALRDLHWDVTFLGASVPAGQLEPFLVEHRPDALLLGLSMIGRLPAAVDCGRAARNAGVPVVMGGAPVEAHPDCATIAGAHLGGADAPSVDRLLRRIVDRAAPAPDPPREPEAEARGDLARSRLDVHLDLLRHLEATCAGSLRPDQFDALSSGAAELVEALAATELLDRPEPFEETVRWLRRVLTARSVPPEVTDGAVRDLAAVVRLRAPEAAPVVEGTLDVDPA
jgi:methanogenic corrinoid protein MtbC1